MTPSFPVRSASRQTHCIAWRQVRNFMGAINYADTRLVQLGPSAQHIRDRELRSHRLSA
jgi:hypothetical protein